MYTKDYSFIFMANNKVSRDRKKHRMHWIRVKNFIKVFIVHKIVPKIVF